MTDTNGPNDKAPRSEAETPRRPPLRKRRPIRSRLPSSEAAELKDKLLRTLAEMENLRRRTEREVADARVYGIASFARDVLTVADNMQRALQALDDELREKADASVKALLDGVELTERELLKALEKNGIKKIEPQGEKFDPNFHQAMYEVPDASVPVGPRRAGRAAGLHHRRSRAAPGFGRRLQGRAENQRGRRKQRQRRELLKRVTHRAISAE